MQLISACGRAGSEDPGEALAEQLLANRLKRCPRSPSWPGRFKVQPRQALGSAEVGQLELELPDVVVVVDGSCGRQPTFCKQAVPLGDRGGRLVGEIQPAYDLAALPAAVGGLGGATEQQGGGGEKFRSENRGRGHWTSWSGDVRLERY
jgi:hypothetical protein